jgi:hypothetical protein
MNCDSCSIQQFVNILSRRVSVCKTALALYVSLRDCPLYQMLRVKYPELFRDATNVTNAISSAQIARYLYDWYLMHVESAAWS